MLGLVGETGSLLAEAKKKQRDAASYLGYAEAVAEEIGDVLWYLAAVARRHRLALSDIAAAALITNGVYRAGDNAALSLHALQPADTRTCLPLRASSISSKAQGRESRLASATKASLS